MGALGRVTEQLVAAHRSGTKLALLFDYDGTLTPIVGHPTLAALATAMRGVLGRLAEVRNVAVGVLSSRGLADLKERVALPGLYYAGNSGLELDLRGRPVVLPEAEACRGLVGFLLPTLEYLASGFPGAWVEDKGFGLTVHYRQVACAQHRELWEQTARALRPFAGVVRVLNGPLAWEISAALVWDEDTAVFWDKGSALCHIVCDVGPPALPVYAGDGPNDVPALEAAAALGGVAIGVGPHAPRLPHFPLRDPTELLAFLFGLLAALEGGVGPAMLGLSGILLASDETPRSGLT